MKKTIFICNKCNKEVTDDVSYLIMHTEPIKIAIKKDFEQNLDAIIKLNTDRPLHLCKKCRIALNEWMLSN